MTINAKIVTDDFDAVRMSSIDPAQRRNRDQVMAEVTEDVYPGPVVKCVRITIFSPVYVAETYEIYRAIFIGLKST